MLSRGPKGCEYVGEEKISSYWLQLEAIGIMDIKSVGNIPMLTVRNEFGVRAGMEEGFNAQTNTTKMMTIYNRSTGRGLGHIGQCPAGKACRVDSCSEDRRAIYSAGRQRPSEIF